MQIRKTGSMSQRMRHRGARMLCCSSRAPVRAEEVKAGDLVITQAWSRATPSGAKIGGGYLTIENKGPRRTG